MLLFATNVLWKTTSGGQDWEVVSPDLSRERPEVPESIGDFRTGDLETMPRRGVIYAVGPSPLDVDTIWAGTDDGLVHVTRDGGKSWKDVTPPELRAWDKVSQIDAGHFDRDTAYIAINAIRRDDMRPHIYRTDDGGATWTRMVSGLEGGGPVNVVREDPARAGLLFAGTEREVYFSADDGEHWQSLRMNMPASSVRDLVIHESDLVVGTHGRSIWILDNIAPLRELAPANDAGRAYLFEPPEATRVRWNMFLDTPLPPEEPAGENPPDGAILDYYLSTGASELTLEVLDGGSVIRTYSSNDRSERLEPTSFRHPTYWIRPPQSLSTEPGHHRFIWDLRHEPPPGAQRDFSIAAVHRRTPSNPDGPFVHPGTYTIRLSVDGSVLEQPLDVRMDPRVEMTAEDVQLQSVNSMACYRGYLELQGIREAIDDALEGLTRDRRDAWMSFRGLGNPSEPDISYGSIYESFPEEETVVGLQQKFLYLLKVFQQADARPTSQALDAVETLQQRLGLLGQGWEDLR